jgi:MSHA biogenesis protein MshN
VSLINKMLKDLETRQGGTSTHPGDRPIFQDLLAVNHDRRRVRGRMLGALAAVVVMAAGYYGVTHWGNQSTSTVATTLPAVEPAPISPVVDTAATPVSSAPAADVTPPATATAAPAPKPPVPTKPVTAARPPVAKPTVAASKVAKSETAQNTGAHFERTERPYSPEELAENAYRDAARLRAQGNPAEAERRLKTLLASNPKQVKARELLVSIQLDSGRWVEAQDTLEQGVAQVPEYLAFRFQLARLYLEHGADDQALTLLESARREGRTDPELSAFLAALYQRAGRHADAVKNYQDALALQPAEGKWWLGLGISLEGTKNVPAARDAYRRALESGRLTANLSRYAEERLRALAAR